MRLEGKTAIVIGAGQGPGEGMGNGRATVLRFAQEGAKVMAVDRDLRLVVERPVPGDRGAGLRTGRAAPRAGRDRAAPRRTARFGNGSLKIPLSNNGSSASAENPRSISSGTEKG